MSHHIYLKDKGKKLLIDCGNVSEDIFESDFEDYKKFRDYICDLPEFDYETKTRDLNIKQLNVLFENFLMSEKINGIHSYFLALEYKLQNQEINLEIIGEEKLVKFPDYKII